MNDKNSSKKRLMIIVTIGFLLALIMYVYPILVDAVQPKKEHQTKIIEVAQPTIIDVPEVIRNAAKQSFKADEDLILLASLKKKIKLKSDIIKMANDANIPLDELGSSIITAKKNTTSEYFNNKTNYQPPEDIVEAPALEQVRSKVFDDIPKSGELEVISKPIIVEESSYYLALKYAYQIDMGEDIAITLSSNGIYWDTSSRSDFYDVRLLSISSDNICVVSMVTKNEKCLRLL